VIGCCCWLTCICFGRRAEAGSWIILFSYSQLFLITTSLSWASVFHNIFCNCKWTEDFCFFWPVHVKKWFLTYNISLLILFCSFTIT
jgi:hypothetical protein